MGGKAYTGGGQAVHGLFQILEERGLKREGGQTVGGPRPYSGRKVKIEKEPDHSL